MSNVYVNKGSYKDKFAMLPNEMLQDERLSWKARGLLCYMVSMPADWVFYETELIKHSKKDGLSSLRSAIKELKELGYVKKVRILDQETKKVIRWETHVSADISTFEPEVQKSTIWDNQKVENRTLQSTYNNKENINTNNILDESKKDAPNERLTKLEKHFFDHYNTLDNLPKCLAYTAKRKKQLNMMFSKYGIDKMIDYVKGMNERPFVISSKSVKANWLKFDAIINEEKYAKYMDGGYMNYCEGYTGPREQTNNLEQPSKPINIWTPDQMFMQE